MTYFPMLVIRNNDKGEGYRLPESTLSMAEIGGVVAEYVAVEFSIDLLDISPMKLSSFLLGDLADLFQDSRIDDVKSTANSAVSSAGHNGKQIARLATVTEQRIQEVEAENAVLGMLLIQVLKKLAEREPGTVEQIVDEVRSQLTSTTTAPKGLAFLNHALNLPETKKKTPIADYARPGVLRPTRPSPPLPVQPQSGA